MVVAETFLYKVRDAQGRVVEGELEADSSTLVVSRLRQMGYVPVSVEQRDSSALKKELHVPGIGNRVKPAEVAVFSRQFATMIDAGLSLIRALGILGDQAENKVLAGVIQTVRLDVERGSSLSNAMARHPKVFTRLFVSMVRAGETGGVLDSVLLQLAETLEKQVELRRKIRSAMTYPVAVLGLVLMIASGMLLFVVPTFKTLYDDLGGTLPLPTRMLLALSSGMVKFAIPALVLQMLAVWQFRRWIAGESGRAVWDAFKLRVPIFGKLVHKTAITRFARTFSVLLHSGVPILESLEITADTVGNAVVARAINASKESIRQGASVAAPLAEHAVFPTMVVQMIAVGEETGSVDEMLERVADFYDQEIEATVDALTSLLEPLLVAVMGAVVGSMVVALYMPMFNVINLVQ